MPVPHRQFKGNSVSIIGIGGSSLGDIKDESEARRVVDEALAAGINFFDNAWEYHDGLSEERVGRFLRGKRDQAFVMTKVCSHGRKKDVAMQMLEDSLRRLQTDHLDLWQIHEVVYDNDPDLHFAPDGAVEALTQAKQQGKVRYVGFTGHKDPDIHLKMLAHRYPFDTVQLPLNPFDKNYRSFQDEVVPEALRQGIAPSGMKSLCGGGNPVKRGVATPEELLRYALSVPGVMTTVSGIDSYDVFVQNLHIAEGFTTMSAADMRALETRVRDLRRRPLGSVQVDEALRRRRGPQTTRLSRPAGVTGMIATPLLLVAMLVAQVVTIPPQRVPLTQNRAPVGVNPPPGARVAPSPRVDRWFAVAASEGSNAEIALAQLALQRGRADEVKSFARKMLAEHLGLMQALAPHLRRVLGKTPPRTLAAADALTYYRLEHASAVEFDQTYVLAQVGGHLSTLGAFQTESAHGADRALKMLVKQWTPTIEAHLQLAVDITQHIGGDSPLKTGAQ